MRDRMDRMLLWMMTVGVKTPQSEQMKTRLLTLRRQGLEWWEVLAVIGRESR